MISKNSSCDEVSTFLKIRLKFSQESIDELQLNGETLYELDEEEINGFNISPEEKANLKNYLKEAKTSEKKDIKITMESNQEEVANFLKQVFGLPENIIQELSLIGENFFNLKDEEIDEFEISDEQKNIWKNYLKNNNSENEIHITEKF